MKCYLASGFHYREELRNLALFLRERNHEVCSTWIWIEKRPDREDDAWSSFATQICHQNMIDLYKADALIIVTKGIRKDGNGGVHSELGFMLARGKPIYIVGNLSNTFSFASDVTKVRDYSELLEKIQDRQIPVRQPAII